jgi:hypothetical protein
MIDCVVRIIGDVPDTERGYGQVRAVRGTGFLCGVPSRNISGLRYGYVVTAHHVIADQNHPEVQAAVPHSRGMELQPPVEVLGWEQPLNKVDLAIARFGGDHSGWYGGLVTDRNFLPPQVTPLLGGHIHYIGILEPEDRVMARSGTLGALDQEGLEHEDGYVYTAHLADCRTYAGFSGSPVFAEFAAPVLEAYDQSKLPKIARDPRDTAPRGTTDYYSWLCGMVTWHLADTREPHASLYGVVALLRHQEIWRGLMALQDERDAADEERLTEKRAPRPTNTSTGKTEESEFERFEKLTQQLVNTPKPAKEGREG